MTNIVDIDMYDRQIRTFGINASTKISNSSACIIGLNGGYGTEIAKNLALCGIQQLYFYDGGIITRKDLETGYYYSDKDINKSYSKILSKKINELNPYVKTNIIDNIYDEYNNIINIPIVNVLIVVNQNYENIIKFNIYCRKNNIKFIYLNSHKFEGHIFVDAGNKHIINEVSSENFEPIQLLSIDNTGLVTTNSHDFQSGDLIEIYNIQGVDIEFLNQSWFIDIVSKNTFKLRNFENNNFTFLNGSAKYISQPIEIHHKCISEFAKIDFNYNSNENIAVVSIMGSLVASETIKLISNKYMPISQFFNWEEDGINGSYKDKITDSSWLVVGSGAIGCELLKNLAFLNVKNIKVTDPDVIEKSNLSRQFLFSNNDIGHLKSEIASNKINKMKPNIIIEHYTEKVSFENKSFTDNILKTNISGVFNALDNIIARKYMDEQCFNYNKPLFESGTLGTKGNTQPVIPFITETYSNSTDPVQEKSFPVCTIKNFPNEITHTIHWAMDQFEFFNRGVNNLNNWLSNKNIVFPNTTEGLQMNNDIYLFTNKYHIKEWKDCITWAMDMFYENYNHNIIQLLHNFPKDTLTSEGTLFWSNGKRCPIVLNFNINDQLHLDYIESTVKLLCNSLLIDTSFTIEEMIDEINKYKHEEFIPDKDKVIAKSDSELSEESKKSETTINFYDINKDYTINNVIPQVFEKDNDTNYHIKWINSSSNLRALNYEIIPVDFYTTKGIAGKIIPAISTTTSVVAGLIVIEMLKYLENVELEKYKSTFVNLADNLIISAEPLKAPTVSICGNEFNSWFKFNHEGNCTLLEFKNKYEEMFKSNIEMITYNSSLLYASFMDNENLNNKISLILKDLDEDNDIENQIELLLLFADSNIEIPPIIVKL
jgi:ubiquitin-activating enzyme E1